MLDPMTPGPEGGTRGSVGAAPGHALIQELCRLRQAMLDRERALRPWLRGVDEARRPSAVNDVQYGIPIVDQSALRCRRSDPGRHQLKAINSADYTVTFSPAELVRLNTIFPNGVCDWSKPGVNQTGVVPWPTFGPSPVNLVFDVTNPAVTNPVSRGRR